MCCERPARHSAIARVARSQSPSIIKAFDFVAIALKTGRAKDFARILQFIETGVLDTVRLDAVLARHRLLDTWENFGKRFLTPDNP